MYIYVEREREREIPYTPKKGLPLRLHDCEPKDLSQQSFGGQVSESDLIQLLKCGVTCAILAPAGYQLDALFRAPISEK